MKTVKLYGELGKKFGREFHLDVATPAEALRALTIQIPGLFAYLQEHAADPYKVFVGGKAIDTNEIEHPFSPGEVLIFAPVVGGSGGDVGKIIIGGALMFASGGIATFLGGASGTFLGMSVATMTSSIAGFGLNLIIGGVTSMLSPTPQTPAPANKPDNKPSFNFDGPVNTVAQGNPVPLVYGRMLVGSQVISAGFSTVQETS